MRYLMILMGFMFFEFAQAQKEIPRSKVPLDSVDVNGSYCYQIPKIVKCESTNLVWMELNKRRTRYIKKRYPKDGKYCMKTDKSVLVWQVVYGLPQGNYIEVTNKDTVHLGQFNQGCKVGYWESTDPIRFFLQFDDYDEKLTGFGAYQDIGVNGYKEPYIEIFNQDHKRGKWIFYSRDSLYKLEEEFFPKESRITQKEYTNNILRSVINFDYYYFKDGVCERYDSIGEIIKKVEYSWNRISGKYQFWNSKGQIIVDELIGCDSKINVQGLSYFRDSLGNIIGQGKSFDGLRTGKWNYFDSSKNIYVISDFYFINKRGFDWSFCPIENIAYDFPVNDWYVLNEKGDTTLKAEFLIRGKKLRFNDKKENKYRLFEYKSDKWLETQNIESFEKLYKQIMPMNLKRYYEYWY